MALPSALTENILSIVQFDDYWMNYGKITLTDKNGKTKKLTSLEEFVVYKKGNVKLIVKKNGKDKKEKK